MPVLKLSKRNIDAIKPPVGGKRQETYRDTDLKGYSLRVFASGRKVFMLEYRLGPGQPRKMFKLGDYGALTPDAAKMEYEKKLALIPKGIDPQDKRAKEASMPTLKQWCETYLEEVRQRKKRPEHDERYLGLAAERYGAKKLDKVSRTDVQNHMKQMLRVGKTAVTANRYHASVRACLNEAVRAGHIQFNPAANIHHYPEPTPRARVLSDDEMSRVIDSTNALDDLFTKTALFMLIETGARKSEVLTAQWPDIQFEDGLWRMPDTKSGHPQIIPLSETTLGRLRTLPHLNQWIFPSPKGDGHREDIKRGWLRVRQDAGIPDVRMHDLRRTFGLHIARSAGLHVASKLLRHSSIKVTEQHYAPLGLEELRTALEKHDAEVVQLSSRRGKSA